MERLLLLLAVLQYHCNAAVTNTTHKSIPGRFREVGVGIDYKSLAVIECARQCHRSPSCNGFRMQGSTCTTYIADNATCIANDQTPPMGVGSYYKRDDILLGELHVCPCSVTMLMR